MAEYNVGDEPAKAKTFIRSDRLKKVKLMRGNDSGAWFVKTVYIDPETYQTKVVKSCISDETMGIVLPFIMNHYIDSKLK